MKKTKTCYLTELDVARLEKHAAAPGADANCKTCSTTSWNAP